MTIKNELVDNNIVDKKYSNVTFDQIDNLVQSGQVDIDQVLGFNNLKHYFELKQEQNAENFCWYKKTKLPLEFEFRLTLSTSNKVQKKERDFRSKGLDQYRRLALLWLI